MSSRNGGTVRDEWRSFAATRSARWIVAAAFARRTGGHGRNARATGFERRSRAERSRRGRIRIVVRVRVGNAGARDAAHSHRTRRRDRVSRRRVQHRRRRPILASARRRRPRSRSRLSGLPGARDHCWRAARAARSPGAAWAWIAAVLRLRFHVLEVISTILLNFVAANLVSYLVRGPMQEPTHIYPQTPTIPLAAQLPRFGRDDSPPSRLRDRGSSRVSRAGG